MKARQEITNIINEIVELNNNDVNVAKSATDLLNSLNKTELFDQYLINNFDKLNYKNVKGFIDFLINSVDFQEQLDYFVDNYNG